MFCPRCGAQAPDEAAFCPACGSDLNAARQAAQAAAPTQALPPQPTAPVAPPVQPTQQFPAQPPVMAPPYQGQPLQAPGVPGAYAPAPPKKSKAPIVIVIIIAVLVVLGILVACAFFGLAALRQQSLVNTPASSGTSTTTGSQAGAASPEAAIDAWYAAVAKGDIAAVKQTATTDFATSIDANMFEGQDPQLSYRIAGVDTQGDQATVDVQESPTDAPAQLTVTYTVRKQANGRWLIAGYNTAATDSSNGTSGGTSTTFDKAAAMDVVDRFLSDLKDGNGSVAKSLATARFKSANPGWIFGPTSAFSFTVTDAVQQGEVWIVTTKEQWQSGDETGKYTVAVQNGKGLVDRRDGLE